MPEHPAEYKGRSVVVVRTVDELRAWLLEHGAASDAVWVTVWKKAAGPGALTYGQIVEESLCHGWIDSTVNTFDDTSFLMLLAPRKKGSVWAATNKERVARMTAEGRMRQTGQRVIDAAKTDGSWTILDPVEAMIEPEDLIVAIDAAGMRAEWEAMTPGRRKQVLYQLVLAKTAPTRAKRIDGAVDALRAGRDT